MTQPESQTTYIFAYSRFGCGCAYQNSFETTLLCPVHRAPLTETQKLRSPTRDFPPVEGLVMSYYFKPQPENLRNSSQNSLHSIVTIRDGQHHEWSEDEEKEVGLCAACYIDQQELVETRITACECSNEDCSYRWCGLLTGLHAFWKLHAQGRCEEATSIPDEDIFSHGECQGLSPDCQQTLDQQRAELEAVGPLLLGAMQASRTQEHHPTHDDPKHALFQMPWLESDYQAMNDSQHHDTIRKMSRLSLVRKLVRLHVLGLFGDTDHTGQNPQLPLPAL